MIALDPVSATEHGEMRAPAIPQEFDDGDHDGEADTWNGAQNRDPREADD